MNLLKRVMPRSLLGRSLLMILIPLVALQAVTFQIFYGTHLDIISRRLTGGEAALLATLANRSGEILSREEIAVALGTDEAGERAIDVQVTRLRRKIEADPREPRFLHTVRGRGYVLKPGA